MKPTHLVAVMLLASVISSCGNKIIMQPKIQEKNDSIAAKDTTTQTQQPKVVGYEGILPCSKCAGVTTYLEISGDNLSATMSLSHADDPFVEAEYSYVLNTERGYEKDENATVYILNSDKPEGQQMYFVRETGNDSTIFEIKKNRKRFTDKKNHRLKKIID